jgi:hypothetical protein
MSLFVFSDRKISKYIANTHGLTQNFLTDLTQGAGREVVAHLVQASELVANLTKWLTRRHFLKRVNEFLPGK